jgi:hypothetical protein
MSSPPDWIEYVPALQDEHAEEPAAMATILSTGEKNPIPESFVPANTTVVNGILNTKYTKCVHEANIRLFLLYILYCTFTFIQAYPSPCECMTLIPRDVA